MTDGHFILAILFKQIVPIVALVFSDLNISNPKPCQEIKSKQFTLTMGHEPWPMPIANGPWSVWKVCLLSLVWYGFGLEIF